MAIISKLEQIDTAAFELIMFWQRNSKYKGWVIGRAKEAMHELKPGEKIETYEDYQTIRKRRL